MIDEAYNKVKNQLGPCGITCGSCVLGNGTIADTATKTKEFINGYGIKEWAPLVPGGKELNWQETEKTLDWLTQYALCNGCEQGGGPPDCTIRTCANEKNHSVCNQCDELEKCEKFDWLKDYGTILKNTLSENIGLSKQEYIKKQLKQNNN
jgi:hypothetical protein